MIDPKLQDELRSRFNPDGSDLRNMQLRMLDMLKYIDKVCRENNIRYWLSSGTCLGAVRHGGFIPWDDDCDIEMLEDDYKKFIYIMDHKINSQYAIQHHKNDPGYCYPFSKVRDLRSKIYETHQKDSYYIYRGIYIDVFCLIKCNNLFIYKCGNFLKNKEYKYKILSFTTKKKYYKHASQVYNILNSLCTPIFESILKIGKCSVFRHNFGTCFLLPRYYNEIFPLTKIKFEDCVFPIPGNYDAYLKKIYGDYNKLPNLDNINTHITKYELL